MYARSMHALTATPNFFMVYNGIWSRIKAMWCYIIFFHAVISRLMCIMCITIVAENNDVNNFLWNSSTLCYIETYPRVIDSSTSIDRSKHKQSLVLCSACFFAYADEIFSTMWIYGCYVDNTRIFCKRQPTIYQSNVHVSEKLT